MKRGMDTQSFIGEKTVFSCVCMINFFFLFPPMTRVLFNL